MLASAIRGAFYVSRYHYGKIVTLNYFWYIAPAPPADPNAPKDSSLCIIPGCTAKKFAEPNGVTHPYCGRTHAELGKKNNILREILV